MNSSSSFEQQYKCYANALFWLQQVDLSDLPLDKKLRHLEKSNSLMEIMIDINSNIIAELSRGENAQKEDEVLSELSDDEESGWLSPRRPRMNKVIKISDDNSSANTAIPAPNDDRSVFDELESIGWLSPDVFPKEEREPDIVLPSSVCLRRSNRLKGRNLTKLFEDEDSDIELPRNVTVRKHQKKTKTQLK